jgi:hypothetical protein
MLQVLRKGTTCHHLPATFGPYRAVEQAHLSHRVQKVLSSGQAASHCRGDPYTSVIRYCVSCYIPRNGTDSGRMMALGNIRKAEGAETQESEVASTALGRKERCLTVTLVTRQIISGFWILCYM